MHSSKRKKTYPQEKKEPALPIKVSRADFNRYVNPYLSRGKRGPKTKIARHKIFNYILYVLHTGVQWNQLPIKRREISWGAVYQHHNQWSKDGSYLNLFETSVQILFEKNKLDLSILHGDGSNTVAKKGARVLATPGTNSRKE